LELIGVARLCVDFDASAVIFLRQIEVYTTKTITKTLSTFALVLFTVTLFINLPILPTITDSHIVTLMNSNVAKPQMMPADYPFNFTEVSWDQATVNEYREHQWNSTRYRFGPSVNWHTRNATSNEIIAWDEEIPLNSWFDFIIEIPKTALGSQVPHAVAIQGSYFNLSEMEDGEMNQEGPHPISLLAMYYVPEDKWEIYSSKQTNWPEGPPGELPENFTLSDIFGPMVEPFANLDEINSDYRPGVEAYWGRFRVSFNSSTLPGFYAFTAMAFDSSFQPIAESQFSETGGRLIGVDLHGIVNSAFGGYYTISRLDDDGDILYTANRGEDFNFTVTISNATFMENVTIHMTAPSQLKVQKWVYGPYQESEIRYGAWEWNQLAGTYIWNASAVVTWAEPKYGYHWEETYTWVNMGKEYNFYDPWGDWTEVRQSWPSFSIAYDFSTGSWMYYAAYNYENHTFIDSEWKYVHWEEYEPWSLEFPVPFVLNETSSDVYINVLGKLVVQFRGHISEDMLPSGSEYGDTIKIYERLFNHLGQELVNYVHLPIAEPYERIDYENQRELAIDTPVSIVKLIHKGEPYSPSWMFQANIGEIFTVSSRLQGGIEYADDIDGVAFILYGHDERRGFDLGIEWWQYSDIQVEVKVSPVGAIQINVYNYTVRTSWGYGEHYEWVHVEIAPGIWETQRVLVSDWFWQELIWDFEANDWTEQHFPMKSSKAKMPTSFLIAGNVTYSVIGDDLKVAFDVTPLPDMPALEWWWEYIYGNLTWVTDYESGWGSHTVLGWTEDTVYHYYNGTDIVYVDSPFKAPIFRNNATGELYEREKIPYIIINGRPEPLKTYIFGEFDYTYETLLREEYDYVLDETRHFVKLINGSELEVFGDQIAAIFNITLMNGTSFLSFNEYPEYMGWVEGIDYYYMIGVDGSLITGQWPIIWDGYLATRYDVTPVTMIEHRYVSYATPIAPYEPSKTRPIYMVGWPQSVGPDHWVIYLNETWERIDIWRYWEDGGLYYYHNYTDGRLYVFQWPYELMQCNYLGQDLFIPHYATKLFAYVIVGGTNYPIPQAGEPLNGWWDLDWIIQNKYSLEFATINGTTYTAKKLLEWNGFDWVPYQEYHPGPPMPYYYDVYWVNVSGTVYNLTDWGWDPSYGEYVMSYQWFPESYPWVTKANGSHFVSEVFHTDWTIAVGETNQTTLEFESSAWLDVVTGYYDGDYYSSSIFSWNSTHVPGYEYVLTSSGEEFTHNSTWRAVFHNITLSNGTFFYSAWEHPNIWPTDVTNWEIDTFYMIDIYGVEHWWYGWDEYTSDVIVVTNVTGDPWGGGTFWFEGADVPVLRYNVTQWDWDGWTWFMSKHEEDSIWPQFYEFIQAGNGTIYEIVPLHYTPESYRYNFPSWQFYSNGVWYNISGRSDMIYKAYRFEGYSKKLDYAPLPVTVITTQDVLITGAPEWGMWDADLWTINPETGALDLDGNLDTTADQFFIEEFHSSTDIYNITHEYLDVSIYWEPDNSSWADEFYLHSFTGMVTFNWIFSWVEYYIWTKASTGETLTAAEFDAVKNILFDQWGNPKPGYWGVSWLAENFTSADLVQRAIEEGWDWVPDNSREWSWLWWELDEHYSSEISNGTHSELMDINLAYEYAGMFAWEDEDDDNFMDVSSESLGDAEMSHYWMPIDVESVSFVTPGEAFGNFNSTDTMLLDVNDTIDFGVTFTNVTGMVFPFGQFSYWDWYDGKYHGSDFSTFNERPTECTTEEFSLVVHFTGIVNETGSNIAQVKFDITIGDWDIDTPGGRSVIEGVSLAVAFYSDLSIVSGGGGGATASYLDDYSQVLSNDVASPSSNYTMTSGVSSVALMSLGGAPYSWTKNASQQCTVDAQTVPIAAVSAIYVSGGGGTATTFSISSEQFYTLIGFKWWDGWAVSVDPIFVAYVSPGSADTEAPSFGSTFHSAVEITGVDYVHIEASVSDAGGSQIAGVKVWDIDNNVNYSMTFNEGLNVWEVNIPRSIDGRYNFNYQIVATDNAGNVAYTSTQSFMFRDNIAPTIDTLNIVNGTNPMGHEIATVTATVSDTGGSGIDYVILTYWNTTGVFNVTMTFSVGSYSGEIPNHAPSTIVQYGVTAYDIDGNLEWSGWDTFTFSLGAGPDTIGPSVTLVSHDPTSPGSSDAVTVSADIQDVSDVSSAVLQYRVDSGAWNNVTMNSVGTTWSAVIPAQADGSTVIYRIVAYDTVGNEAVSGEYSYDVEDVVTTPTTPTQPTTSRPPPPPPPIGDESLLMVYGAFGALVIIVLLLAARRRK